MDGEPLIREMTAGRSQQWERPAAIWSKNPGPPRRRGNPAPLFYYLCFRVMKRKRPSLCFMPPGDETKKTVPVFHQHFAAQGTGSGPGGSVLGFRRCAVFQIPDVRAVIQMLAGQSPEKQGDTKQHDAPEENQKPSSVHSAVWDFPWKVRSFFLFLASLYPGHQENAREKCQHTGFRF